MNTKVAEEIMAVVGAIRSRDSMARKEAEYRAGAADAVALIEKIAQEAESDEEKAKGTHAIANNNLEGIGRLTSVLGTTALGAGIGHLAHRYGGTDRGAGTGALAGLAAGLSANAIGRAGAAVSASRTGQEQANHDRKMRWLQLLVPGMSSYDAGKRREREVIHQWH